METHASAVQPSTSLLARAWILGLTFAMLWAVTAFAAPPAAASTSVNVQTDCHATGNGTTDDTAAFLCALNLLNASGGTLVVPAGTYLVQPGALVVPGNVAVSGAGIGATTLKADVVGEFLLDVQGANISVSGLTIEGANLALRGMTIRGGSNTVGIKTVALQNFTQPTDATSPLYNGVPAGIRVEGNGDGVTIDTVSVKNVVAINTNGPNWPHKVARGVWIAPASGQTTTTKNITIQNSSFYEVAPKDDGDCIAIQDSSDAANLTITGNTFDRCHKRAIKIQVPGVTVTNNTINNPFLNDNFYDTYTNSPAQDMWSAISVYASNVVVDGNTITSNGGGSFYGAIESDAAGCSDLSRIAITNNRIQMGPAATTLVGASLIRAFAPVNGLTIANNTIDVAQNGIVTHPRVDNLSVTGNTIGPSVTSQFQYYGLTCAVSPTPLPTPSAAGVQTVAVPSYVAPGAAWSQLEAGAPTVGLTIINPNSGPGSFNFNYVNQVQQARAAGLTVLGYVHTSSGTRSSAVVKTEVDQYYAWYDVDGIFFDEASTDCSLEPYFADLNSYVKARGGVARTALNPGTATNECYIAAADILVTFENTAAVYASAYTAPGWVANYPPNRFWHLVHTATTSQAMHDAVILSKLRGAGWVYVTPNPGSLPTDNPWGSLPTDPFWSAELGVAKLGSLVDLGGGNTARGINSLGQVVGILQTASGGSSAFVYTDGTLTDMNSLLTAGSGWVLTEADAINDSGQIAGQGTLNGAKRAFLFSNGSVTDLGNLPGYTFATPTGMNNLSQVVGVATLSGGLHSNTVMHGFVWTPGSTGGTMRDLGLFPGGTRSVAKAINDSGVVVGWADLPGPSGSLPHNGFVWQGGGLTALGTFFNGFNYSDALAISTTGAVVGDAAPTAHTLHPFFGSKANVGTDLGTLGGNTSVANAVNTAGQVVGYSDMASGLQHAFVWDAVGGLRDLNAALPTGQTWVLMSAVGINASGQVIGAGQINGLPHAFLGLTTPSTGSPPNPNPIPDLVALSPLSTAAGSASFTLSVSGAQFVGGSQVQWNGRPLTTNFVSSTQLTATIQAADVATAGSAEVTVVTPAPGGGMTTPRVFFITASGAPVTASSSATGRDAQSSPQASVGGSGVGTPGSLTATASGSGTVTVAQYLADPVGQLAPNGTTNYFDVHLSSNSGFTSLTLVDCNLTGSPGTTGYGILYWWNGAGWNQAAPQRFDATTNCTTLTINSPSASPGLVQLSGTPFAVVIDSVPPTTTASATAADGTPYSSGGWTAQTVTVSLSAADNVGGSGVKQITYSAAGAQPLPVTVVPASTATIAVSVEGTTTLNYFATDLAGNQEQRRLLVVKIDRTAPVMTVTPTHGALDRGLPLINVVGMGEVKNQAGATVGSLTFTCWDTHGVVLSLAATDVGSGVASLTYSATGAQSIAPTTVLTTASAQLTIVKRGRTTVTYVASDVAGNTAAPGSESIIVGDGYACAAPTPNFALPDDGSLAITGTVTIGGVSRPFKTTFSF